ncbi:ACP phosphodiesterase [Pollutibacter soli]|uniref:acyl carrier protein phosphodiesterase n=1 Tax=Pollutibacter soli TaxID=3034157 RepID=UPI00301412A6
MNYLAHASLSFDHPEILVGNMISDFVKGKDKFSYSEEIRKGINLHRSIDNFTDQHPVNHEAKKIFQPHYRLYSGAFLDVLYDHFLATDEERYPEDKLKFFSSVTYKTLSTFEPVFPLRFAGMFPYMQKQDWLYNYRLESGVQRSFQGLVHRALYMDESETAFRLFRKHYSALKNFYQLFYPELELFARQQFNELTRL